MEIHSASSEIRALTEQGFDIKEIAKRLRHCGNTRDLEQARRLHVEISRSRKDHETFIGNLLVEMYGSLRELEEARKAFQVIKKKNVFSWNILIAANARNGEFKVAIGLFWEMHLEGVKADKFTFTTLIQTCLKARAFQEAKRLHWCIDCSGAPELDVVGRSELIRMYGELGCVEEAKKVFKSMSERDVFSWTAMMSAYVRSGHYEEALELFWRMASRDKVAFLMAIEACGESKNLEAGSKLHEQLRSSPVDVDCVLANALVSMYGRCGSLENALKVFHSIHNKTVVSWTAVIGACVQNNDPEHAMELFRVMDVPVNALTYVNVLEACSGMVSLTNGRLLHEEIQNSVLEPDEALLTAILKMYGRCGGVEYARKVFDSMQKRDVVAWSAMITAYAANGQHIKALKLFYRMQVEGYRPNQVTFVSVLSACSCAGLLEQVCYQYASMVRDRRINPGVDHCACVIDAIGKSGCFEAAREFIDQTLVVRDHPEAWLSLLSTSKMQGNVRIGLYCARRVLQIEHNSQALKSYLEWLNAEAC